MTNLTALQQAVIEQLGYEELDKDCASQLKDMARWGIDGGFSGFIYYSDTCKFFDDNRALILAQLEEDAFSFGEDMLTMISHFNCLTDNQRKPMYSPTEIMNAIYNQDDENETDIKNALAWYAGETVAYQLEEEIEEVLNQEEEDEE